MGVSVQCQCRIIFPCRIAECKRASVNTVIMTVRDKDIRSAHIHAQGRWNFYLYIIRLAFIFFSKGIYGDKRIKIIVSHYKADYRWNAESKRMVFNSISKNGAQIPDSVTAKNQCIGIRTPLFNYRFESGCISVRVCHNKCIGLLFLGKGKDILLRTQDTALVLFKAIA